MYHILCHKRNPGHITEAKFQQIDKRFSKSSLSCMSSDLKKVFGYSHMTENDLVHRQGEDQMTEIKKWDVWEKVKPHTMSHCSKCNMCIYKLDHHCPWFNQCVGAHNLHMFLSLLLYTSLFWALNFWMLISHRNSEAYNTHLYLSRFMIWVNFFMSYSLTPYCFMEFFINANGRTFLELLYEAFKGPTKPKYKLLTGWRENMYLVYGSRYLSIAIVFPYFFGAPITGLEFWFLPAHSEVEDFIGDTFRPLQKLLGDEPQNK